MPLSGSVVRAPSGAKGFDSNTVLTTTHLTDLKSNGFTFCLRYISRGESEGSGDLSVAEANRILGAGFALMPVQHVASQGWSPSGDLGKNNGQHAAAHAADIGFPAGINVGSISKGPPAERRPRISSITAMRGSEKSRRRALSRGFTSARAPA
jgi:hypothetical protein